MVNGLTELGKLHIILKNFKSPKIPTIMSQVPNVLRQSAQSINAENPHPMDEVEEVRKLINEEIELDHRFDDCAELEGEIISSGIINYLKRKKLKFKKQWNFIFSNNNKGRLAVGAQIVPFEKVILPHNKNLEPVRVQQKEKENLSWKNKKQRKQYNKNERLRY